jgi:hypothetical protein
MDSRQQFEEWAVTQAGALELADLRFVESHGEYYWAITRAMWSAWQASRESLVVELPERKWSDADLYTIYGDSCGRGDCLDYDETIEAINCAGITWK